MNRIYGFSAFVLAMASVLVMAWPQNASAQWKNSSSTTNTVRVVGAAAMGYKGYKNAIGKVNRESQQELNRLRLRSQIVGTNTAAVAGVKNLSISKAARIDHNLIPMPRQTGSFLRSDFLVRETLYKNAIGALIAGDNKKFNSLIRRSSDAWYAPAQYAYAMSNLERCEGRARDKWLKLLRHSANLGYAHACAYISALFDNYNSEGNYKSNADSAFVWAKVASALGSYDGHLLAGNYALAKGDTLLGVMYVTRAYKYELWLDSLYARNKGERSLDFCRAYYENTHSCASWLAPELYDTFLSQRLLKAKTKAEHMACYNLAQFVSDRYYTPFSDIILANYYMGLGDLMPANPENVVQCLKRASDMIPLAKSQLADCYYSGYGVKRDSVYASTLYREAAEGGAAEAMNMLTYLYYEAGRYDSARVWGTRPELADSAEIQHLVGCTYYIENEYNKALDYFVRAADGGSVYGKWMAYVVYSTVLHDEDKAFEYVEKAAEAGYPDAINDLAVCYLDGDHVDRDVAKSLQLLEQAKDAGCLNAYANLGYVYCAKKSVYGMKPDRKRAAEYWREGAEKGNADSMYNYAACLIKGKCGVAKNKAEGYSLMRKAAEAGSQEAVEFLDKAGIVEH